MVLNGLRHAVGGRALEAEDGDEVLLQLAPLEHLEEVVHASNPEAVLVAELATSGQLSIDHRCTQGGCRYSAVPFRQLVSATLASDDL